MGRERPGRGARTLAVALVALAWSADARAVYQYEVIDLGTVSGGSASYYGHAINNRGEVAGTVSWGGLHHAFLYGGGQMTDLGCLSGGTLSSAVDINDFGMIVGYSGTPHGYHAFAFANGMMADLGTLGGVDSFATAINNRGEIAGTAYTADQTQHVFTYCDGVMTDLSELASFPMNYVGVHGMNDKGEITGSAFTGNGTVSMYVYRGGTMHSVAVSGWLNSDGNDINERGQITGRAWNAASEGRAVLYSEGEAVELGVLPGCSWSSGADINDWGQVVGSNGIGEEETKAFLYDRGDMYDLNALVSGSHAWALSAAHGINDAGWITGWGTNPAGEVHAFILKPIIELGDVNLDAEVNALDTDRPAIVPIFAVEELQEAPASTDRTMRFA